MRTASPHWPEDSHAELLVDELTHRFYNSLQVINSLLSTATRGHEPPDTMMSLVDAVRERVAALSSLHRRLAQPRERYEVLENHCREICLDLVRAFGREDVTPWLRMEDIALPDGLEHRFVYLVAELVTNAIKYSRTDGAGMIWIELRRRTGKEFELLVRDNGIANPMTTITPAPKIASALAKSLGGELTVRRDGGFVASVRFPI